MEGSEEAGHVDGRCLCFARGVRKSLLSLVSSIEVWVGTRHLNIYMYIMINDNRAST